MNKSIYQIITPASIMIPTLFPCFKRSDFKRDYFFVSLLISLIPIFWGFIFIYGVMRSHFSAFTPTFWNDQASYWHETATFIKSGFYGGYYAIDEHTAPNPFFRFGAHGPSYAVIYGSLGRLFG